VIVEVNQSSRIVTASPDIFLSTATARPWDRRLAFAVMFSSLAALVLAIPFAQYRWPVTPSFIAAYESALALNDLITAVLLIGQARHARNVGILIIACGYLFDAAMVVAHCLSFPGVFSEQGLLGSSRQTTPWIYITWHGIFPLFICAYALVVHTKWDVSLEHRRFRQAIAVGVIGAAGLAGVCTLVASAGADLLPPLISGSNFRLVVTSGIGPVTWLICFVAAVLLWVRTRGRTVLDLWLTVVMVAWLLDILLSAMISTVRFDFGYYAGRIYGLMAASFVLGALLLEANQLYGRLARALGDAKEKNTALAALHEQALRNLTAANQAEEKAKQSEERFRLLVESAEDHALFMLDAAGNVASWNAGAERVKGYRSDEIVGRHFSCFYPLGDIAAMKPEKELESAAVNGKAEHEGWRVRKDGSRYWANVVTTALRDEKGDLRGFAKVSRDITVRRQAEEAERQRQALEQRAAELKRSNDDLQQFAYIAAHDLQEPLRMVASFTQLLGQRYKGRLDADADEFITFAVDGAHRMQLLIQGLLAYCRVGTAGKELQETSSTAALQKALVNLRGAIADSGGSVTHDSLPTVIADNTQLMQLFQNIVGNAIKYRGAEPPRVHVAAKKNGGDEWVFSISDNGIGIDSQYFAKIFAMFQRLHGRGEFSGTGIGLTVCKKIAERHGGRIWVESAVGKGSTFYFALPERGSHELRAG